MKKAILAKHTGRNDDKNIRYWNFSEKTKNWCNAEESVYAIVDTNYGYQIVEIIGVAKIKDEMKVDKDVIAFIPNDYLSKEAEANE